MGDAQRDGNPARLVTQVGRLMTRYFDRRLEPLGIAVAHLVVLGALRDGAQKSQKELCEIGQIGQPAMAQMLERLTREGVVVRSADPGDRRKALFALSTRMRAAMPAVEAQIVEGNADVFSALEAEEFADLVRLLQRLEQRLETRLGGA